MLTVTDSWSVTVSVTVRVDSNMDESWYTADVIYRNEREQPVFDVAVMSLRGFNNKNLREMEIAKCCDEGKTCFTF